MRRFADEAEGMAAPDWIDDDAEVMTLVEAAVISDTHPETVRRWCVETRPRIGKLYADSLWLISRRRLLMYIERRFGRMAMLAAADRGKAGSTPQQSTRMLVGSKT
jgi:hypothetical protein